MAGGSLPTAPHCAWVRAQLVRRPSGLRPALGRTVRGEFAHLVKPGREPAAEQALVQVAQYLDRHHAEQHRQHQSQQAALASLLTGQA